MPLSDLNGYQRLYEYGFRCWLHFCEEDPRFESATPDAQVNMLKRLPVKMQAQETLRSAYWKIRGSRGKNQKRVPFSLTRMEWENVNDYFSNAREKWEQADTTDQ